MKLTMSAWVVAFIQTSVLIALSLGVRAADSVVEGVSDTQSVYKVVDSPLSLPSLDGRAWALLEYNSGILVIGKDAKLPLPPASITKLMTNYAVYHALDSGRVTLNDPVLISEKAWRAEGSRMFAEINSRVSLGNLLKSTVIQSGNDAAVALSEHIAGSELEFVKTMNLLARKLGLHQSRFTNSTGLTEKGHQMSALDIAKLSAAIIRDYPEFYERYAQKSFSHNGITQYNRNKLIWHDNSVDGLKTGFTEAAGYCLVGSAIRNGQRWIAVVLGSSNERSRERAVLDLLNYGFTAYQSMVALTPDDNLVRLPVYGGEAEQVNTSVREPIRIVVPTGREESIVVSHHVKSYYQAPIKSGDVLGSVTIALDDKVLTRAPMIATHGVTEGNLWRQLIDSIKVRLLRGLGNSE